MEAPRTFSFPPHHRPEPAPAAFYDANFQFPPQQHGVSRSPNGSPDSFVDARQHQHQYTPQPAPYVSQTAGMFQPYQQPAWGGPKLELDGEHSHSSASSSPALSHPLNGDYNTTPSPPPQSQQQKTFAFIALPGNQVRKRPRRRYDEIERLYPCNWPNCNKSYGTLNHLNAHVTMQRHGEKRSPNEFKEMRKQWRKAKKEEQAMHAVQQHHHHHHSPSSMGYPSPTDFSPVDSEQHFPGGPGVHMPRRMSLPNLSLGLPLDSPPPLPPFPTLPTLNLSAIPPHDFWVQQQHHGEHPQSAPPHQVSYIEPLQMPQQRGGLPLDSTLLTPLRNDD